MKDTHIGALQVALGATFWSFAGVLGKWLPWNALTINGVRADLNDTERTALYRVFSTTVLGGEESEIAGTATNGVAGTVWTSTAPVSVEKAFYKVKVVPNR